MYQFFVDSSQIDGDTIRIAGADYNHIRNVLRMRQGDRFHVSVSDGRAFFVHLSEYSQKEAIAYIDKEDLQTTELPVRVTLFQGIPKSDKMETIIQKSVELGVAEIIPVEMKNCVVKLDPKKVENRIRRWQAVAESAAKQSKRGYIPQVLAPVSWKEAISLAKSLDITLVPYENEHGMQGTREAVSCIRPGQTVGIMIGPEGGFAPEEIAAVPGTGKKDYAGTDTETVSVDAVAADNSNEDGSFYRISLGRRILRTETAGPAALAMLSYVLEE